MLKPVRLLAECYDKHFAIFNLIKTFIIKTFIIKTFIIKTFIIKTFIIKT